LDILGLPKHVARSAHAVPGLAGRCFRGRGQRDISITKSIDATNISLTYTKVLAATDLTYTIEQSTDLTTWQTVTPTNQILSDNGIVQVIKAQVPRSNAGPGGKLFLRLRVTAAN
jgi:hypothetical protein